MPNWCNNSLQITGNTEDDRKLDEIFSHDNPFQAIFPCPEELDDEGAHTWGGSDKDNHDQIRARLKKKYGYENGMSWRVSNWQTKWDACEIQNEGDGMFYFDTAWSPPIGVYVQMTKLFPNATFLFTYEEPGVGFMGEGAYENSHFSDNCRDYVDPDGPDEEYLESTEQSNPSKTTVIGAYTIPKLP